MSTVIKNAYKNTYFGAILVFFIALLPRVVFLNFIPTGITDDELNFVINAKAVMLTGQDIAGVWSPLSLRPITGEFPQAELPYLLMAPFIGLVPFSLFASKLPYAIISCGIAVVLYLISLRLLGRPQALLIGIVAALNPWGIFFGRTAYEAPLAIFFYLLAFYLLTVLKRWHVLLAFIPLFLAFYSYMGTKFIFIPFAAVTIFYSWLEINKKKFTKFYVILFLLCVGLFAFFLITLTSSSTSSRLSELSTLQNPSVSKTVDNERRLTTQTPLTKVFSNKPIVYGKEQIEKYLKVFSPEFLFIQGETRSTFSLWFHGYFYYIDAAFMLLGMCYLFAYKRRVFVLLLALLALSPIPTLASNGNTGFAALRSALIFPLLCIFIGSGIYYLLCIPKRRWITIGVGSIIFIVYLFHVFNFIHVYFNRYPVYSSEAYGLSYRVISKYIELANEKDIRVTVVANGSKTFFNHYLFDTNSYRNDTKDQIRNIVSNPQPYTFANATFSRCTDKLSIVSDSAVILHSDMVCPQVPKGEKSLTIPQLSDGGKLFSIENDTLCSKYPLNSYPQNFKFTDFDISNLTEEEFCKTFITSN